MTTTRYRRSIQRLFGRFRPRFCEVDFLRVDHHYRSNPARFISNIEEGPWAFHSSSVVAVSESAKRLS